MTKPADPANIRDKQPQQQQPKQQQQSDKHQQQQQQPKQQVKSNPVTASVTRDSDNLYFTFVTKPTMVSAEFFESVVAANNGKQDMAIAALMHHIGVHFAKNILEYVEGIRGGVQIPVVESPPS